MRTYLCLVVGIAGLVLNSAIGYTRVSENVLGLLVLGSLVLIGMGFVPAYRKWPHARVATVAMSAAIALYAILAVVQCS